MLLCEKRVVKRAACVVLVCVAAVAAGAGAANGAESFYDRKPADIFLGKQAPLAVDTVAVSDSGTVKADLSNGMVVLLKENHTAPVAIAQVTVRAGSIYEEEYLGAGISHLFEHLMSGGTTTTRTEEETRKILDSLGGMTNAYTSYDRTSYYIKTTADKLPTAIELLADWMMNTKVTQEEFDREMQVVQREYERTATRPSRVLFELAAQNMFHVYPVRYPILGYPQVRAKLTLDDVYRYRGRMYVPNNMVFVVVGDIKWQDALERVRAAFDGFERGAVPSISLPQEPQQVKRRLVRKELENLNTTLINASYHTITLTHPDLYPLDVLAAVLGQGESSRLVRTLKNERNLVQSISAWSYTPGYDAGVFTVFASVPEPQNVQPVLDAVAAELERCKTEPIDAAELERVKNQVAAQHVYGSETIESQASSLVMGYLSAGDPDFDERYVEGIQKVTPEEVLRVANTYFPDDKLCITIVEPKKTEKAAPAEARHAHARPVKKVTLANGLTLLLKRNPNVPIVAFELYFLGGLRAETEQNNGISNFMAQLWSKSTANRTPLQLAEELENMGAKLSTGSGNNTFFLRATCLARDFEKMTGIVSDVVLNPAFDKAEAEKVRTRILAAIRQREDSIYSQAQLLLNETFYGAGSPYAMDSLGTVESVKSLSAADLAAFYRSRARGPDGVLAVYGDIDPEKAAKILAEAFAALQAEPAPEIPPARQAKLDENKTVTGTRERKGAAAVYFAFPGIRITDLEDREPMKLLDVVLSGGSNPGGWLHEALRGAGLVYEVHAFNIMGLDPRHFEIYAITNPATVRQVRRIVLEKVDKMKKGEITPEEFDRAKTICITEELMGRQTNSAQAMTAAINELYGLGYEFADSFADRVNAVTINDVVRVAQKYLTHYVCAIVAPKADEAAGPADEPASEPPE